MNFYSLKQVLQISIIILLFFTTDAFATEYEVNVSAGKLVCDETGSTISLSGGVRFLHRDVTLTGDVAVFNKKTRSGRIKGNVTMRQPGVEIGGKEMTVDFNRQLASIEGKVKMTVEPDNSITSGTSAENLVSALTTLTAQKIEYNWAASLGTATGGVTVVQGARRAYADRAIYDGFADVITLEGNVRFEQGSGDWMNAERAVLDMRREVFTASGGVAGSFIVEVGGDQPDAVRSMKIIPDKIPSPPLPFREIKTPE